MEREPKKANVSEVRKHGRVTRKGSHTVTGLGKITEVSVVSIL